MTPRVSGDEASEACFDWESGHPTGLLMDAIAKPGAHVYATRKGVTYSGEVLGIYGNCVSLGQDATSGVFFNYPGWKIVVKFPKETRRN